MAILAAMILMLKILGLACLIVLAAGILIILFKCIIAVLKEIDKTK